MIEYLIGLKDDENISYSSKVFTLNPQNTVDFNQLKYYKQEARY